LADSKVEEKLRTLGFGYRAKFIQSSAQSVLDHGGEQWLLTLRQKPYAEAKSELLNLCGVGAKVADCVCLMSLDKNGAVPVDTHVLQIAQQYLKAGIVGRVSAVEPKTEVKDVVSAKPEQREEKNSKNNLRRKLSKVAKTDCADLSKLMASTKTLTPRVYDAIADYFRSIWGAEFAGWAQSVVFAADLKAFAKDGTDETKETKKSMSPLRKKKKRS